jgi:hypothetical protein
MRRPVGWVDLDASGRTSTKASASGRSASSSMVVGSRGTLSCRHRGHACAGMRILPCAVRGGHDQYDARYTRERGMGTNLILSGLGVEHGEEHVPVAITLLLVGSQDLTEGRWRRLWESEWSGSVDIHSAMNTNLFEKPTSGCEDSDRGH